MAVNGRVFQTMFNASVGALLGLGLLSAAILHGRLVLNLDRDGENSSSEGVTLYGLHCAQTGQAVYRDYHTPPHVLSGYMPLFYYGPGYLSRWLRADRLGTYMVGRYYVYAFWLGIGVGVYKLARHAGSARLYATLAAALWLGGLISPQWANSFRPDAMALFFSLAAVWLYLQGSSSQHLAVSTALLMLAFLHKQTAIAPLLVILAEECRLRRWGRAVAVATGWGAALAIIVTVAQRLTGGTFVMNVSSFVHPFTVWRQALYLMTWTLSTNAAVFLASIWACATIATPAPASLLKRYFIVALALALLRSTNYGASQNHYLEPYAIGCVLTAILLQRWQDTPAGLRGRLLRLGWLGVAMAASIYTLSIRTAQIPALIAESIHHRTVRDGEARDWDTLLARVAKLGEPILTEDNYLDLRRGLTPLMLDASLLGELQLHGRFDDADLRRKIAAGEFGAIITTEPFEATLLWRYFPSQWIEIMRHSYRLTDRIPLKSLDTTYYIYQPKE